MIEAALKYWEQGFNVVPCNSKKIPTSKSWKDWQEKPTPPDVMKFQEKNCEGIAVVCGKGNGGLECIDIDCKYDLTGTLFERYKELIHKNDPSLLKQLVVQKTGSGGYHFFYLCDNYQGNKKLANRYTTEEEKKGQDDKVRVLIETRGQGGYVCCVPMKGYSWVYGDLTKLKKITNEQRDILILTARLFNEVADNVTKPTKEEQVYEKLDSNPFDDFAKRGDIIPYFEEAGWAVVFQQADKIALKRPNSEHPYSGYVFKNTQIFFCHSTSTAFDNEIGYTAGKTLAKLKFNDNLGDTARYLLSQGFGEEKKIEKKDEIESTFSSKRINSDDEDLSFLASEEETNDYVIKKRNNTFKVGLSTGFPKFDEYWRYKDAQFEMVLGHDNSGKTIVTLYMATLDAMMHGTKYAIYAGENSVGGVKLRIIEYYRCRKVESMTEQELKEANDWFSKHFWLIRNDEVWSYMDMLVMGKKLGEKFGINKIIIEPYNVLEKETANEHQYDYKAMRDMRIFIKKTGIGIILNIHAATEALRKTYPKEHEYFGYTIPPNKADAEGGSKFPNKADNLLVVHRMADHPTEWVWTELHVQKVKEMETGGKRTFKNEPFKIRMIHGGAGFEDANGFNPVLAYWDAKEKPVQQSIKPNNNFEVKSISTPRAKQSERFPDPDF